MKTILVATDFNELATAALRHAVPIARACRATIVLVYADTFEPPAEFTATQLESLKEAIEASRQSAAAELERYAAEHIPPDVKHVTVVRNDLPVPAIVQTADEFDADLIAMGTHGRGAVARLLFGSVAEGVLRHTKRPVLTVRAPRAAGEPPAVVAPPAVKACQ
jgi:nucleotide-binding universal stress UspA family protein